MALTVLQLAAAMRQGDGVTALVEPLLSIITRLHGVGEAAVALLAPDAPVAVRDEAVIRYASYLYDTPSGTSGDRYAASWRNSGAGALVAGWVIRGVADSEAVTSLGGVSVSRINQLIEAAIEVHTAVIAAHHSPGGDSVIDEDAVRQIVADSLSPGSARGGEFARTPTLPTAATTAGINVDFVIGDMAPTGAEVDGNLTRLPHIRPSPDIIGVWAVALVGDVETDETFIPWGGGGIEEEKDSINEFGYHGLSFTPAGSSGDRYLDVVTAHRRGSFWSLNLEGDGDTLPADSTVRFFLAVASGVTVEAGGTPVPGDGLGMAAVLALIADHTGLSEAHHVPGTGGGGGGSNEPSAGANRTQYQRQHPFGIASRRRGCRQRYDPDWHGCGGRRDRFRYCECWSGVSHRYHVNRQHRCMGLDRHSGRGTGAHNNRPNCGGSCPERDHHPYFQPPERATCWHKSATGTEMESQHVRVGGGLRRRSRLLWRGSAVRLRARRGGPCSRAEYRRQAD